jgi:hypothetical protein
MTELQRDLSFRLQQPRLLLAPFRRREQGAADDGDKQEDAERDGVVRLLNCQGT